MRGILQFVAIVVVMVAARYAPLGDIVRWLTRPAAHAPIVTGSLQDGPQVAGAMDAPVRRPRDAAADVRSILAQASSEQSSNNNAQKQRRPARNRNREDETADDGEIYIGGTGLLDDDEVAGGDHPLASKYPDDYLVICEAGCRPASDRIVYKVSKIAAAAAAQTQRKMEVTSAADNSGNENNEVVCVAGCYDEEPVTRRRASVSRERPTVQLAKVETPVGDIAPEHDQTRAVEAQHEVQAAVVEAAVRKPAVQPDTKLAAPNETAEPVAAGALEPPAAPPVPAAVAVTTASIEPPVAAASSPAPLAAPVEAKLSDIAAVHAISAETAARRQAKHAALAPKARQPAWETKVTSLVVLNKPAHPQRSVVALQTAAPFSTTVSVESGWDFTLSNTP